MNPTSENERRERIHTTATVIIAAGTLGLLLAAVIHGIIFYGAWQYPKAPVSEASTSSPTTVNVPSPQNLSLSNSNSVVEKPTPRISLKTAPQEVQEEEVTCFDSETEEEVECPEEGPE